MESGQRVVYGLKWGLYDADGGATTAPKARCLHLFQGLFAGQVGESFVKGLIPAVGNVLVNIVGVDVPSVPQGDAHFPGAQGMVVQAGQPIDVPLSQIAQGPLNHRLAVDQVGGNYFIHRFRGDVAIEHPRLSGQLNVQERLSVA
ncbi:MAG: hypothetical protein ACE5Q6_26865 [Dehalococcoidia bacterium]